MRKNNLMLMTFLLLILLISSCANQEEVYPEDNNTPLPDVTEKNTEKINNNIESYLSDVLQPDSINYLGAFLLPDDGNSEKNMFSYGGEALCYNPENKSLFIVGHSWHTYVAEITIPDSVISKEISQLNKSEIIKDFTDIKGNLFNKWTMEIPRVGLEVVNDKLFFCFGEHYEEDTALGTHGYTDLNLSKANKVCVVGDYLYSTNDYLFSIPKDHIEYFFGNDLLTGRFRDGGWSGMGLSLFALSSDDIINAQNNQRIDVTPIIKYTDSYNGDDGHKMDDYSHADSWTGGGFVSCDAGDAIVFVGTHSYGSTWYGFSNGVVYPIAGDENAVYPDVPDYPHDERGWWSDDFRACIVMYDVKDAFKVVSGDIKPYEIQPYAYVDLSEYMIANRDETVMQYLGGAAYDGENNRLFILELFAEEDKPVVHVFEFE